MRFVIFGMMLTMTACAADDQSFGARFMRAFGKSAQDTWGHPGPYQPPSADIHRQQQCDPKAQDASGHWLYECD